MQVLVAYEYSNSVDDVRDAPPDRQVSAVVEETEIKWLDGECSSYRNFVVGVNQQSSILAESAKNLQCFLYQATHNALISTVAGKCHDVDTKQLKP